MPTTLDNCPIIPEPRPDAYLHGRHNGTDYRVPLSMISGASKIIFGVASIDTPGEFVATTSPAITEYLQNVIYFITFTAVPASTNRLNIDGLGDKVIKKLSSGSKIDITSSDVDTQLPIMMMYDGTDFIIFGSSSTQFIQVTYAQLLAAITAKKLTRGRMYYVTDRGDRGIFLYACTTGSTTFSGVGIFLNADYNTIGDFTALTTANGYSVNATNVNLGIWSSGMIVPTAGDVAIYNGLHYLSKTGSIGTAPNVDTTNWQVIPKLANFKNGYFEEADAIEFDVANDWFASRADKRGNRIKLSKLTDDNIFTTGVPAVSTFQWGRNDWYGNVFEEGYISALNFIGSISNNRGFLSSIKNLTTFSGGGVGIISGNVIENFSAIQSCEFTTSDSKIIGCEIKNNSAIANKSIGPVTIQNLVLDRAMWTDVLDLYDSITGQTSAYGSKPLERILDMDAAGIFSAGVLSIPDGCQAYGKFILTSSNASESITDIVGGMAPNKNFRFYPETGLAVTFNYVSITGAAANKIIGGGVGTSDIIDGTKKQWIEYRYEGTNTFRQYFQKYL